MPIYNDIYYNNNGTYNNYVDNNDTYGGGYVPPTGGSGGYVPPTGWQVTTPNLTGIKYLIVLRFNSYAEGLDYMQNNNKQNTFCVGINWEQWFDYQGNLITEPLDYLHSCVITVPDLLTDNVITDVNSFENNKVCSYGGYLFMNI